MIRRSCLLSFLILLGLGPFVFGVEVSKPARPSRLPWWESETAMNSKGELLLDQQPWWKKAVALKVGESFRLKSDVGEGGQMIVRREKITRYNGKVCEAIVWVIDDDGDLAADATDGDKDSDCYVVDYGCDGKVDRMVDYIDNDRDGRSDETEIRYFHKGRLSVAWMGKDLDRDGRIWDIVGYEYSYDFFRSDPYGDGLVWANKYDPERRCWVPISECPFAFYDTDGDAQSEAVVRVSAVPLDFDPQKETDPGNSLIKPKIPFQDRMRKIGVVNVRYSIDLDGKSSAHLPLHYDMGFNMTGKVPYEFEGMKQKNRLRRAPKTIVTLPHDRGIELAESYPAEQTGFSWREAADDSVTLGVGPRADEDRRWEGVFWMWDRRFMHNTGNPTQRWNVRREFRPTPSKKRELYYSGVDRRIHLKGATEGWVEVGYLGDGPDGKNEGKPSERAWGEIRMFDTDKDGYFDRWEIYRADNPKPVRVSTVRDQRVRDLPTDWKELEDIYNEEIFPEALKSNCRLIAAMSKIDPQFVTPADLTRALKVAEDHSQCHYVLDLIRETRYQALRSKLLQEAKRLMDAAPSEKEHKRKKERTARTTEAWTFSRRITDLDAAYAEGRYEEAIKILERLPSLKK